MTLRCEQCGYESDTRYRFCGMCGAKLPQPPPPPEPIAAKPAREEPTRPVSGPSFLGLADEPASTGAYLLEDEVSEHHWGRYVVLLIVLLGLGAAAWHWGGEVRLYVASRLAQRPSSDQSEQASSPAAPVSTSASEKAQQTTGATAAGNASNTGTTETPATPAAAAQNPISPANTAASSEQTSGASAPSQTNQTSAAAAPSEKQESVGAASVGNQQSNGGAETAATGSEAPKTESAAAKPSRSEVKETPAPRASADQLEAEGERYLYGNGVSANCSRAETDLHAAAEQGSSKADSVLATMYATGHCVNRDLPLAYRWFAMALKRDPGNARLQDDLRVLWNQMTPDERQIALRRQ